MKKWLLTLLAGYAAGLAVAMKFRKDKWTSKLTSWTPEDSVEGFINEVVDIHRVVFDEAVKFFDDHLDDVTDFDALKSKVEKVISEFIPEIQTKIDTLNAEGEAKKQEALDLIEKSYGEKQAFLQTAHARAERFVDGGSAFLKSWVTEVTRKLDAAYEKLKKDTQA